MKKDKRVWRVWTEDAEGNEVKTLFAGCHTKALAYYKSHGGDKVGLHLGYDIPED